jgi:hypothetical protein
LNDYGVPTEEEVFGYFETLSNWGRWGPEDELGTLNLITPQKRLEAIAGVREGVAVGCARPIAAEAGAADVNTPPQHFMTRSGDSPAAVMSSDFLGVTPHGYTITHVDTLAHVFWEDKMYNDRPKSLVTTTEGATVCSVETMKDGIVTRGVLLDIARLKGKAYLDAGEPVMAEDLEAAEAAQGVTVGAGDALLIRTGWSGRRDELGPHPLHPQRRPRRQPNRLCQDAR